MSKQVIHTDRLMRPIAHFSHAVRIGNLLHIGATAGTDAARQLAGSTRGLADIQAQTGQMFDNIGTVLELSGATIDDVVRIKTYLADTRDLEKYRRGYAAWAVGREFSHTVVGSAGFPLPQALVEADLVAIIGEGKRKRGTGAGAELHSSVSIGDRHFCSVTAMPERGAPDDPAAQFRRAFDRLVSTLTAAQFQVRDVANVHVTLADIRDAPAFETCYRTVFAEPFPSGSIVVAQLVDANACMQIETVCHAGGGQLIGGELASAGVLFSPAMLAGDELYISGQCGTSEGKAADTNVETQTRQAWKRVSRLLAQCGMGNAHVLRTNNILTDWRYYAAFNAGYGANVIEPYPPRATVQGGLLPAGARVQVEGIAHRRGDAASVLTVPGPI